MLLATRRWTLAAVVVLVAVPLLVGSPAHADPGRVTKGDAEAVLHASENGAAAMLYTPGGLVAAPLDSIVREPQVSIRPYPESEWDGRHFCAEDWHVILVAWIEGGDRSFTVQDAQAIFDTLSIQFSLDGAYLATERTATTRFLNLEFLADLGWDRGYVFQQGTLMAPDDLAVGAHTLSWTLMSPDYGTFTLEITFYIDPAGTGACL
jgi:hypothetical protein